MKLKLIFLSVILCLSARAETNSLPKFDEIYQLIRANGRVSEKELNRAAVLGLLAGLESKAILVTNTAAAPNSKLVSRTTVFDKAFAYFRLKKIEGGVSEALNETYQKIAATNKIKGVVLDLRFASGTDYSAAAKIADLFLATKEPLLGWGETALQSTAKTNAIDVPVAVLVNRQTSGAAEALAAIIRETQIGLILGTNTAGQASVFKEFPLENGQVLKIATTPVQLGNRKEISPAGLRPDIEIAVNAEDEKAYYQNSYWISQKEKAATENNGVTSAETTRPRRRINEAELVRLQREGISAEEFLNEEPKENEPGEPVLGDPSLVRALDLLKGLSVVRQTRK